MVGRATGARSKAGRRTGTHARPVQRRSAGDNASSADAAECSVERWASGTHHPVRPSASISSHDHCVSSPLRLDAGAAAERRDRTRYRRCTSSSERTVRPVRVLARRRTRNGASPSSRTANAWAGTCASARRASAAVCPRTTARPARRRTRRSGQRSNASRIRGQPPSTRRGRHRRSRRGSRP